MEVGTATRIVPLIAGFVREPLMLPLHRYNLDLQRSAGHLFRILAVSAVSLALCSMEFNLHSRNRTLSHIYVAEHVYTFQLYCE